MKGKLLVVDASWYVHRAFHALPPLSNARGVPTQATLGFTTMLQKVIRDEHPDFVVVAWDTPGPTRRAEQYAEYKAQREATPEDLSRQISDIHRIVAAYGIRSLEWPGEEADDVIATLVRCAREEGVEVTIVSADRDLMQLIGEHVRLLDTYRDRRVGPAEVEERFGVPPEKMLDLRALIGDPSDNIPGVRGIGEKGAAELIRTWGSLDALIEHAQELEPPRYRKALLAGIEDARLSRDLSRLREDLELSLELDEARVPEPDRETLAEIFAELELKRLLEDLGRAPAPARPDVEVEVELARDRAAVEALAKRLADSGPLALACALEPDEAMRGELVAIALSASEQRACVVPIAEAGEEAVLEALRPLLERADAIWLGHDLKRDWLALRRRGVELAGELRDVAVGAYVVDPAQQVRRPEVLARAFLGREIRDRESAFGKGAKRRLLDGVDPGELAAQLGPETACARPLDGALAERLDSTGQRELYERIEVPLVGVLARMELAGVRIDEELLRTLAVELRSDLGRIEARVHELAGEKFLINSPKQLQRILFEKLQLPPTKKTKTGFSTDESVLEELSIDYDLPREILGYRKLSKLLSTYVEALPGLVHPETGRIHCSFNQTVAATGRLSASNPNLQNIPVRTPAGQRIREAFVPAEGRVLFSADYSQIELRILAHLSGDEALVEAFRSGDDVHVRTASRVFGIPPEQVTDEQRSRMKGINFGIIYGSSAFGIARQLGIAQSEAREHIRAYFERYPGVRTFLDRAVESAREQGYAETLYGRRRYLPDLRSRNRAQRAAAERMAVNSSIQGTAADIIKRAMVEIDAELRASGRKACMILQVHDELLFDTPAGELEGVADLVLDRMKRVCELSVPVEVHAGSGPNWREAH